MNKIKPFFAKLIWGNLARFHIVGLTHLGLMFKPYSSHAVNSIKFISVLTLFTEFFLEWVQIIIISFKIIIIVAKKSNIMFLISNPLI